MILDLKGKTEFRFKALEDIPGFVSLCEDFSNLKELKLQVVCDDPRDFAEFLYQKLASGLVPLLVGNTTVTVMDNNPQYEVGGVDFKFDWLQS